MCEIGGSGHAHISHTPGPNTLRLPVWSRQKQECTSSADSHFKNVREEAKALKWLFALVNL